MVGDQARQWRRQQNCNPSMDGMSSPDSTETQFSLSTRSSGNTTYWTAYTHAAAFVLFYLLPLKKNSRLCHLYVFWAPPLNVDTVKLNSTFMASRHYRNYSRRSDWVGLLYINFPRSRRPISRLALTQSCLVASFIYVISLSTTLFDSCRVAEKSWSHTHTHTSYCFKQPSPRSLWWILS